MRSALSLGLAIFILGAAFGAAGLKLYSDVTQERSAGSMTSTAPGVASLNGEAKQTRSVPIAEQGLTLEIRSTDSLIRLATDDKTISGIRVYDTYSNGDPQTAVGVDLVWERRTELFDQPEATSLEDYRKPTVTGLSIQETRELRIDGREAVKQLYTATASVPGPFGSTSEQPVPNQLRYVIADGDRFIILRAPAIRQTFLDAVAQGLRFGVAEQGDDQSVPLDIQLDGSGETVEAASPTQASEGALQVDSDSGGLQLD